MSIARLCSNSHVGYLHLVTQTRGGAKAMSVLLLWSSASPLDPEIKFIEERRADWVSVLQLLSPVIVWVTGSWLPLQVLHQGGATGLLSLCRVLEQTSKNAFPEHSSDLFTETTVSSFRTSALCFITRMLLQACIRRVAEVGCFQHGSNL